MFITSIAQIEPGLLWSSARLTAAGRFAAYLALDHSALWPATIPSGLTTDALNQAIQPWFSNCSRYYADGVDANAITPTDGQPSPVHTDAVRAAAADYAQTGYLVLYADSGRIRQADSAHWAPIVHHQDLGTITGGVLAYPWSTKQESAQPQMGYPDRIDIVAPGMWRRTFTFNGQTLGNQLTDEPTSVTALWSYGSGDSLFLPLEPLVRSLTIRMAALDRVLNSHSDPHLQGPSSALDERGQFALDPKGSFLPRTDTDDPPYAYLVWNPQMSAARERIDQLLLSIGTATGIPTAQHRSSSTPESGESLQRQSYSSIARTLAVRGGIMETLTKLTDRAWTWDGVPFQEPQAHTNEQIDLLAAGIINIPEARAALALKQRPGRVNNDAAESRRPDSEPPARE